jgi:Na+/proline symporter
MAHVNPSGGATDPTRDLAPPTNRPLMVVAGICLAIPVVALLWVSSYAKETPKLGGVPFFFWYQFLWVFLTSALTYTAHRLVLLARKPRQAAKEEGR